MKKFEEIAIWLAVLSVFVALFGFFAGGYMNDYSELLLSAPSGIYAWVTAIGFIVAILCLTAVFYCRNKNDDPLDVEDLSACAGVVMILSFILGVIMALISMIFPYNDVIAPGILWSTAGMFSLGLLGLIPLFVVQVVKDFKIRNYKGVTASIGLIVVLGVGAVVIDGLFGLFELSDAAIMILGGIIGAAALLIGVASLLPPLLNRFKR